MRAWRNAVLAQKGPITDDELARLVPLANQAHHLNNLYFGTIWLDAFSIEDVKEEFADAREASKGNPEYAIREEWILAELQGDPISDKRRLRSWADYPDSLIMQALEHQDPQVRLFGVDRFARRVYLVIIAGDAPLPAGEEIITSLANNDPDAEVRARARAILRHKAGFLHNGTP
jgi:hypothetical protein